MFDDFTGSGERARPGPASILAERLLRRLARGFAASAPQGSLLVELPGGQAVRLGRLSGSGEPSLLLRNFRVFRKLLSGGPIGFAEAYMDGDVECTDLAGLFRFFLANRTALEANARRLLTVRLPDRLLHLLRRNSRAGSRRNIAEHYDLGNDFFRRFLDADMHYSSGLYLRPGESCAEAQANKVERILELLELEGGETILEIGCGWGAFARRAAAGGHAVTGLTLSREQLALSRERAREAGLEERCTFRLEDYRETGGRFDRIVSIEMIEAVGEAYWPVYFRTLADRLADGGVAVLQAITIDEERFAHYRRSPDFIQRYVFPGGMLPTADAIARQAEKAGLVLDRTERFGLSYAETLAEWSRRFEAEWPAIAALGFDERFRRRWRYYFAYCQAGFEAGAIDVGFYRLRRPG